MLERMMKGEVRFGTRKKEVKETHYGGNISLLYITS